MSYSDILNYFLRQYRTYSNIKTVDAGTQSFTKQLLRKLTTYSNSERKYLNVGQSKAKRFVRSSSCKLSSSWYVYHSVYEAQITTWWRLKTHRRRRNRSTTFNKIYSVWTTGLTQKQRKAIKDQVNQDTNLVVDKLWISNNSNSHDPLIETQAARY